MTKRLRLAPIIRVSTEEQEKKDESLRIQKNMITQSVKALSGVIPDHCWKYTGQEHATPDGSYFNASYQESQMLANIRY